MSRKSGAQLPCSLFSCLLRCHISNNTQVRSFSQIILNPRVARDHQAWNAWGISLNSEMAHTSHASLSRNWPIGFYVSSLQDGHRHKTVWYALKYLPLAFFSCYIPSIAFGCQFFEVHSKAFPCNLRNTEVRKKMINEMNHILNCGYQISRLWTKFMQYHCVCRSLKNLGFQRDLNSWPRDAGATLWPTELWSHGIECFGHLWSQMFPWKSPVFEITSSPRPRLR